MSSTEEVPETYMAILASSPQLRTFELSDKFNIDEQQKLGLLDALAGICVSQAKEEVYASAMESGPEKCTIFIIGNHEEVPQHTQDYLTDVCRRLTDVAHLADAAGRYTLLIEDLSPETQNSINEIYRVVHLFTFPKFFARLTKWDSPRRERFADIGHRVQETDRKKFEELTDTFNDLYLLATHFHERHATMLVDLLGTISLDLNLSNTDTAAFIHRLDVIPMSDGRAGMYHHIDWTLKMLYTHSLCVVTAPFSIERHLRKVLKTYNETTKLVCFAVSSRRGHIFKNQPNLIFLRSEKRHVELDIKTAIPNLERQMEVTDEDRVFLDRFINKGGGQLEEQYTCCPHCECAMLATLLQRWKMQQRPAPIIGVSKLSCFGCRLYFMAYKAACDQLSRSDLPSSFIVTGAHNTLYLPWVSPDLTSIDRGLHAGVQHHLLRLAQRASVAHVMSSRPYSESTTHSAEKGMKVRKMSRKDIVRSWMADINMSS